MPLRPGKPLVDEAAGEEARRHAARAARDELLHGGRPLTRDTLAARLHADGIRVRNVRLSTLLALARAEAAATRHLPKDRAEMSQGTADGAAIEVTGLTKSYRDVHAVDGVNLRIERGEIFALLGPNGAGKTTTVEILEGYRHRDGGEVRVLGFDPATQRRALKPRIGIVLQSTGVDNYLTVAETIAIYSSYYSNPRPVD